MVRILVSAVDNHQITNGTLTGAARATVRRRFDPYMMVVDGPGPGTNGFGFAHESTTWVGLVSSPGPTNPAWLHPDTGLAMSMNPNVYIIEGDPVPPTEPFLATLFDVEMDGDNLIQKRSHQLIVGGVAPNTLTPPELAELEATHRLRLVRGRFLVVFGLRPSPPT